MTRGKNRRRLPEERFRTLTHAWRLGNTVGLAYEEEHPESQRRTCGKCGAVFYAALPRAVCSLDCLRRQA